MLNTSNGTEVPFPVIFSPEGPYIIIDSEATFKILVVTKKNIEHSYGIKLFMDG